MFRVMKVMKFITMAGLVMLPVVCSAQTPPPATAAVQANSYLGVALAPDGTWAVRTVQGDPEVAGDNGYAITSAAKGAYTLLSVDGEEVAFDASNTAPYASNSSLGHYDVSLGPGNERYARNGYFVYADQLIGSVKVKVRYSLVRDMVRMLVMVENPSTSDDEENPAIAHTIGLKQCAAISMGAASPTFYTLVPAKGVFSETVDLKGTDVPSFIELYDNRTNPTFGLRAMFTGEDAGPAPSRVAVGRMDGNVAWDFTPILDRDIPDSWAAWWDPVTIQPGETKVYIMYFGMAAASAKWTSTTGSEDPHVLAVQGPKALSVNYDTSALPQNMLVGNPFPVKAYIYNLDRDSTLNGLTASIQLPDGLELMPGSSQVQSIDTVGTETESLSTVWSVRANGKVSGILDYIVTVNGGAGFRKSVTRSIVVPATSTTSFTSGYQLVSIPFTFSDSRIEQALNLQPDSFEAYTFDPTLSIRGDYKEVVSVTPGSAFFLKLDGAIDPEVLALDAKPSAGTEQFRIDLKPGWNMIGNPFLYRVPWGQIKVWKNAQTPTMSIDKAVESYLIRPTIYWYNTSTLQYELSANLNTQLMPYRGYWVRALQACTLVIPAIQEINGSVTGDTTRSARLASAPTSSSKTGWTLQLVAKSAGAVDGKATVGVDTRAADGYDSSDVERPPSIGKYVAISFKHGDWGVNNGAYMSDIRRSASTTTSWEFDAATDQPDTDVVLSWPNLSAVPKGYTMKLVDLDAGVSRYMRTTSSYRFNTGNSGSRRFRIVAEPSAAGRLMITGLTVNATRAVGNAVMSYNVSSDATTDVRIKSATGKVVRTVAESKASTRGFSNLSWNYCDADGKPVPAGAYVMEVVATTPEGEVAKAIRPFMVAR